MIYFVLNFVTFQILWFSNVLGSGGYDWMWAGIIGAIPLFVLTFWSEFRQNDVLLALTCVGGGFVMDTLWIQLGILDLGSTVAPLWICTLWFGLGLTINHSLKWFRDQRVLGPIVVGAFGPVTYFTGQSLGAATILEPTLLPLISITWAAFFYLLTVLANYPHQTKAVTSSS